MVITGNISLNGSETQLYRDTSAITSCEGLYQVGGTSVCSDVITLAITSTQLVRFVKISTTDYLNHCEVQIFAGDQLYVFLFYNISEDGLVHVYLEYLYL